MYFLQNATNQISQSLNPLQDIVKALHDADKTNTGLVYATIALALATIIFGFWDRKRQNDERFERVRPWIVIDGPIPVLVVYGNRGSISWNEYLKLNANLQPPSAVKVGMRFTNTGTRPAKNLKQISFRQDNIITRQETKNQQEIDMYLDFGPNQSQYYLFEITWDEWMKLISTPTFFALQISYDNGRSRSYSGGIYKFVKAEWELITGWYD